MSDFQSNLKESTIAGIGKGFRAIIWIGKILIPISFIVTLLQWTGWLNQVYSIVAPVMNIIGLPAEATLPILTGMLLNIYAAIGIISALPFTSAQITLIAIFLLISHSLIMEGAIQARAGINVIKATLIRIIAATLTVFIVSRLLGDTVSGIAILPETALQKPILDIITVWAIDTALLILKILVIVMIVMIVLEISKSFQLINRLNTLLRPVMAVFGLSEKATTIFLAGILFGLFYGGALIVEEGKKNILSKSEVESLHISLGINHALIEDPTLFAVFGINLLWLWIPRMITAILAVHLYRCITTLISKRVNP